MIRLDCPGTISKLAGVTDQTALAVLKAAKVSSVTINGDTATARVVGAAAPASLRRINGSWKVDALGLDATQATGATSEVTTVQARLNAAGFIPEDEGADSSVVGSLRVAGMHIDFYATSDKATVGKHEIDKVFVSHPGRGTTLQADTRVYWIARPRTLHPSELKKFAKLVGVAENG